VRVLLDVTPVIWFRNGDAPAGQAKARAAIRDAGESAVPDRDEGAQKTGQMK